MKSDVSDIVAIMRGFRDGQDRLEQLRMKEIRESSIVRSLPLFTGVFRMAIKDQLPRRPVALSKTLRMYLGVEQ